MKQIVVLLVLVFGLVSVACAQEGEIPELDNPNNAQKREKAWAPLIRAQSIVVKNFPTAYPANNSWTIGSGGYEQKFWKEEGRGRTELYVLLSFEGRLFYWVNDKLREIK
ncbi:MAG: hypothetical protein ACD_81C00029G0011 [uncultured bacterium]|nr:MAG: hypothetical protein ACD_81C00029G0011 [uncultured bacterium]